MKGGRGLVFLSASLLIILLSCAPPVLKKETITSAIVVIPEELRKDPESSKGRLYIFGGLVVTVKNQKEGSVIEGVLIPTDRKGYLQEGRYEGRFIARSKEFLDPVIYKAGRFVTIAGHFTGFEKGQIGEMEYNYPAFDIKEIYLWPTVTSPLCEERFPKVPWWYDPWFYPWYDPWWRYRYPP